MKQRLLYNLGIVDLDYILTKDTVIHVNGVRKSKRLWICPFYDRWSGIIKRVTHKGDTARDICYQDVGVSEDWIYASKFKTWMSSQIWKGLELDKDILSSGSKIYSEETCCFVPRYINSLLKNNSRGSYPIGVSFSDYNYLARVNKFDGYNQNSKYLGRFKTPEAAHRAWQIAKANIVEETICIYMTEQCYRQDVADELHAKAERLRDDAKHSRITLLV